MEARCNRIFLLLTKSLGFNPPATHIYSMKLSLPNGKITIRHRQMRNMFQCFAGRAYINGASGDTEHEAAQELANQYEVPLGTVATVYGYKLPTKILIP